MSSKHLSADTLVERLKKWTRNSNQLDIEGDTVEGLDTAYILFALNEGKQQIQGAIANLHKKHFAEYVTSSISSRSKTVAIPDRAINDNRIIKLEYATTDEEKKYRKVALKDMQELCYVEGEPENYAIMGDKVLLEPVPDTGYLRFLIQTRDPSLDVRRGLVESINQSGGYLESIVLAAGSFLDNVNVDELEIAEWITAVDYKGDIILSEIAISEYDASSRTLTVVPNSTAYTDELDGGGQFIVIGDRASTHSQMPAETMGYYVEWAKARILYQDASTEAISELAFIQSIRERILEGMAEDADTQDIPISGSLTGSWFGG